MGAWKISRVGKRPNLKDPILIEGLPGIGNVGKVVVDFIVDELGAKKLYEFSSYTFPHSVFINENNLVELPSIEIYYKKFRNKKHDIVLLAGDVQPSDEVSCYEFTEKLLDIAKYLHVQEIVTLGGIGLQHPPKSPKVYCTANSKECIKKYCSNGLKVQNDLYGVVGPIIGVTGLLVGLSQKRNIDAVALLAETFGHPMYLGVKGAKEILRVLNKKFDLDLNLEDLDREIEDVEKNVLKKTDELNLVKKRSALKKLKSKLKGDMEYIG